VTVGGSELNGVSMMLSAPIAVKGVLHSAAPSVNGVAASCRLALHQPWSFDLRAVAFSTGGGQSETVDVFPAKYKVRMQCFGGYPLSVSFGGQDLLANPLLVIGDSAPPPLIVEYKPGGGTLEVKLEDSTAHAVLLAPNFPTLTGPTLVPSGRTSQTFSNLMPGDYTVYGLSEIDDVEFRNPSVLQSLKGGLTVHIGDGKTAEVTIRSVSK
jgi:hypothetical protein